MINMLKPREREYKVAWYLPEDENVENRVRFRYKIVSEQERAYSQPIRNMVTHRNSLVIQTNYMLPFEVGDKVFTDYECNNMFKISNRAKFTYKVNEQSLGMVKNNPLTYWVLELE